MTILDYALIVLIAVLFVAAILYMYRQKKKGKSLCCGCCNGCAMSGKCHNKQ